MWLSIFSIVFVVFLARILLVELCGVLVQVEGGRCKFFGFFLIFVVLSSLFGARRYSFSCLWGCYAGFVLSPYKGYVSVKVTTQYVGVVWVCHDLLCYLLLNCCNILDVF